MTIFKDILCVVDIREDCTAAVERAVTLAESNQASLTVIDVVDRMTAGIGMPEGGTISADLQSAMETSHAQELETLINPYRTDPDQNENAEWDLFSGNHPPGAERRTRCGNQVPEKLAWLDRLFGSDDMNLLRECPCPVWLVKPQTEKSYTRILAAVDVDDSYPPTELKSRHALNRQILEMATSLALSDFAELHVVAVWRAIGESLMRGAFLRTPEAQIVVYVEQVRHRHEASLEGLMRRVTSTLGQDAAEYLNPRPHLVKGWARKEIPILAKQLAADVIVMGTVARTGISGFIMGNTAEMILNQIDCSVLAIKPSGSETPVTVTD